MLKLCGKGQILWLGSKFCGRWKNCGPCKTASPLTADD